MINKTRLLLIFFVLSSTIHCAEDADYSTLEYNYWETFSNCFSQVIFDAPSSAMSRGYYLDNEHKCYVYTHDMISETEDTRLYIIHTVFDQYIGKSQYGNTHFNKEDTTPYIVWKQTEEGILIEGAKYSKDEEKLSSEKYTFENESTNSNYRRIIEKQKYTAEGIHTETLTYTYSDDGRCEIETEIIE
jgi:hypothetical protein